MKIINFILFSNLFIVLCALYMSSYTANILNIELSLMYYGFVATATWSSYSLHWFLSQRTDIQTVRTKWTIQNARLLWYLFIINSVLNLYFSYHFIAFYYAILPLALLTFIYTAPKIPHPIFERLKSYAFAKTFYLAAIWTAVTVILPIVVTQKSWSSLCITFMLNRFFLIYAICTIFDLRDKNEDANSGIKNLITYFSVSQIRYIIYFYILCFTITIFLLYQLQVPNFQLFCMAWPAFFLLATLRKSLTSTSDYWFYGVVDGLMMASAIQWHYAFA